MNSDGPKHMIKCFPELDTDFHGGRLETFHMHGS